MKSILYIFDDINYISGAQKVMLYQIYILLNYYEITIFSLTKPSEEIQNSLEGVEFLDECIWEKNRIISKSLNDVLKDKSIKLSDKLSRIRFALLNYLQKNRNVMKNIIDENMLRKFEAYQTIIVVSEASKLRNTISMIEGPKKIQWIHTDYLAWCDFSSWTKNITCNDSKIYSKFDKIIALTQISKCGLLKKLPVIDGKVEVINNLIPVDDIIKKSKEKCNLVMHNNVINIVSIGRIDVEKAYDRIIEVCRRCREEKFQFKWYIIGDGPLYNDIKNAICRFKLEETLILLGKLENPYPVLKQADYFALLSNYEGMPATIYEALVLNIPIIATDVGGIREQLNNGKYGILVNNKLEDIYNMIRNILQKKNTC